LDRAPLLLKAIELQLKERRPDLATRHEKEWWGFGTDMDPFVAIDYPDGSNAYIGTSPFRPPYRGAHLYVIPPDNDATMICTTQDEAVRLAGWAADTLLGHQPGEPRFLEYTTRYYTPAAVAEYPENLKLANGTPFDVGQVRPPYITDLFESGDFWGIVRAIQVSPRDRTIPLALADFIEEHGFPNLAGVLRRDPRVAKHLLPTKAMFPVQFRSWEY
jgi:hypothetical protein